MVQTFAAMGLGFLLYMILITYASVTAQDVASEKGTKIMEVIFSSIKATDYFYARMIGIFAVILSHLGIYVLGGLAAFLFADRIPLVSQVLKSNPAIQQYIGEAVSLNTLAFVAVSIFMYVVFVGLSWLHGGSTRRYRKSPFASYHAHFSRLHGSFSFGGSRR